MTSQDFHAFTRLDEAAASIRLGNDTAVDAKNIYGDSSEINTPLFWIELGLIPLFPILVCYLFTKIADHIFHRIATYRRVREEPRVQSHKDQSLCGEIAKEHPQASVPRTTKARRSGQRADGHRDTGKLGPRLIKQEDDEGIGGVSINGLTTRRRHAATPSITSTKDRGQSGPVTAVASTNAHSTVESSRVAGANAQQSSEVIEIEETESEHSDWEDGVEIEESEGSEFEL